MFYNYIAHDIIEQYINPEALTHVLATILDHRNP